MLVQYDQTKVIRQSDVQCQRSYYDVSIARPILVAARRRVGMRLLACCDCGFESRRGYGCLFRVLRVSGFCQILNVRGVNDIRQAEIRTAEPLVPEPSAPEVEMAIEDIKKTQITTY